MELCGTVQFAHGRELRSISVYPWSYVVLSRLHTVGTCAVYRFIQLRLTLTIARLIKLKVIVSLCFAGRSQITWMLSQLKHGDKQHYVRKINTIGDIHSDCQIRCK